MTFDPYIELDLPRDATQSAIKPAYRKRTKKTHPDAGGDKKSFERTTRAYLILSDTARRSRYDATGDADEIRPDNSVAQELNIIVGFFAHVARGYALGTYKDPTKHDMLAAFRKEVGAQIAKMEETKRPIEKAADMLRKIEARLKAPAKNAPPAAPLLLDALRRQAASTFEPLAKIEREIQAHRDALQLVKDFSFDFDKDEFAERVLVQRMTRTNIYNRGT